MKQYPVRGAFGAGRKDFVNSIGFLCSRSTGKSVMAQFRLSWFGISDRVAAIRVKDVKDVSH
jgi:hypothetical protein